MDGVSLHSLSVQSCAQGKEGAALSSWLIPSLPAHDLDGDLNASSIQVIMLCMASSVWKIKIRKWKEMEKFCW